MTPGMACGMNSTTLVLMSHMSARATAISMPMNPAPMTTAFCTLPEAQALRSASASSRLFAPPTFLRSRPSTGGTLGVLPVAMIRRS